MGAKPYPSEWEFDALLADGTTVHVRPIRPADGDALRRLHGRLSAQTVYRRFFSFHTTLTDAEVVRFTTVDYVDRFAFAAVRGDELVSVARYDRTGPDIAEVAFVVQDADQGRGIGTLLLEHLAAVARERGIRRFTASTLADNAPMLGVFRDAGYVVQRRLDHGVVDLEFAIDETAESQAAAESRERRSEVASMRRLLFPRSIAVIGAGRRRGTIGHEILRNLLRSEFDGPLYPVNPGARHIAGVPAHPSVEAVPEPVDLAIVVVPASEVLPVVDACGRKGVKSLVVISAGFREVGPEGASAEAELVRRARDHGMRVVGPNCMGIVNTADGVSMNATFAPVEPMRGRVSFLSQSGALGIAVLEEARRVGLGVASFVSVGNKADVSSNDLLQFWETDASTDVVLLYLESFGNPRKFARIARRVSQAKPIVVVKSGRTVGGARAAASHTAAAASPDVTIDALFLQAGVIRVDTLQELFDVALLLANQPVPAGSRVAIVGNSGGPGILAADACEGAGLELADLAAETSAEIRRLVPGAASVANPVDLIASAGPSSYEAAIGALLDDPGVDAVLAIFTPPLVTRADEVAEAVTTAAAGSAKPVLANFLGDHAGPAPLPGGNVPSYPFPEQAVHALGRAARYGAWRRRNLAPPSRFDDVDIDEARDRVARVLGDGADCWMPVDEATALLGAFRIPVVTTEIATTADDAVTAAARQGWPVVLKVANPAVTHKTDLGGVRLGLADEAGVRSAFAALEAAFGANLGGAIVQPMVPAGIETIVGIAQDPAFGPLLMFGLGGVATDVLADRAFRILPLTEQDADDLIRSVRSAPLLFGYRNTPAVAVDALREVLLRTAALAEAVPELVELDLNPLVVHPDGAVVLDTKIRLRRVQPGPGPLLRKLR